MSYEGIHTHPTPSIVPSANRDIYRTIPSHIIHNRAPKPTLSYSPFVISHRHHKPESFANSSFRTESKTSLDRIHALGLALHDTLRLLKRNAKTLGPIAGALTSSAVLSPSSFRALTSLISSSHFPPPQCGTGTTFLPFSVGTKSFPIRDLNSMRAIGIVCLLKHVSLDGV